MGDATNTHPASWHAPAIEVVLFDVGGVLSEDRVEHKLADLAARYDVSFERLMAEKDPVRLRADLGQISDADFWREVLATVGVEATPQDVAIESYLEAVPGTLELARQLYGRVRLAILSNDSRELSQARREHHGLDALFNPILISAYIGLVKPDPRVFHHALAELQVPPAACLFIDNVTENVAAAESVGLRALRFRNATDLAAELQALGLI